MLRLEVRNAETPIERKPPWIKTRAKMGPEYNELMGLVDGRTLPIKFRIETGIAAQVIVSPDSEAITYVVPSSLRQKTLPS